MHAHNNNDVLMTSLAAHFFSLCSTYSQLSPFTLAVLKDSGWYDVNYEVTQTTLDGQAIPYIFGKGYGLMDNNIVKAQVMDGRIIYCVMTYNM